MMGHPFEQWRTCQVCARALSALWAAEGWLGWVLVWPEGGISLNLRLCLLILGR
jgi:hypothetical protein